MVISRCGLHGLHVPTLVEELHYGHVNVTAPTQHLQMAGKTARDRAFNLNFAKSKRVEVSRTLDFVLLERHLLESEGKGVMITFIF